jgi:hypothetical protein
LEDTVITELFIFVHLSISVIAPITACSTGALWFSKIHRTIFTEGNTTELVNDDFVSAEIITTFTNTTFTVVFAFTAVVALATEAVVLRLETNETLKFHLI